MNRIIVQTVVMGLAVAGLSGCGDFFAEKSTEIQSRQILSELTEVRESPNLQNPLPEVYRQPAARLAIKDGVKLFYFTRYHAAEDLADLVKQQLDVSSTVNSPTNQIVAYCRDDVQADAVQKYLELIDVSPIQVNVDCLILERFGNITMDWETSILVENILGEDLTMGEKLGTFFQSKSGDAVTAVKNGEIVKFSASNTFPLIPDSQWNSISPGTLIDLDPAFPGASLRASERSNFGLDFGYWMNQGVDGHQVRAVVDVLVSQGYLKILLNPQLETINGKKATVTIKDYAPIEEVQTGSAGASGVYNITKYVWVENTLSVTPHVYSDGTIGLMTNIKIGSRSKPEGVVQRSIITERSIDVDENRIERGKSLIIGGMRKSEKRSVVRGIPFLKDLPLIGILFSSKDFEEKGTEIIFILTPTISSGGVENIEIVKDLRKKYDEPEYEKSLTDAVTGPFGRDAYTQVLEKKATDAELARVQAEVDLEQARIEAQAEKERADQAEMQAENLRKKAQELQDRVVKAQKQAQEAAQELQTTKSQTQADLQKIEQLEAQKQKILNEAQKIQQEAETALQEAQTARQKAEEAQKEAAEARQKVEEAEQQARQAREKIAAEAAAAKDAEAQPDQEPAPAPAPKPEPTPAPIPAP